MHSYKIYVMREEEHAMFQEACVHLTHLTPPQFKMGDKTALTEEEARALIQMAAAASQGCRLKSDLVKFEPVPITTPPPEES